MADTLPATAPDAAGRLARLAAARIAAQVLGFVWFVYAARSLPPAELGLLSSGLALVVVLGGLCDLGTTRTVVRHVAAHPASLRANLTRGLRLRVAAGVVAGAVATGLLGLATDLEPAAVALAAWIAAASGATEVGFAALRSIGSARTEVRVLVAERTLFTVLAVTALAAGAGPLVVLALYGATNTASALLAGAAGLRQGVGDDPAGPFFDPEGRRTALSSSLLIVAPRASIVVLVLLGTSPAVAAFAVAQKPTEAVSLLVLALAAPVLPILRAKVVGRSEADAGRVAGRTAAAGLAATAGLLGWWVADPQGALTLLLGASRLEGGAGALRLLAIGAGLSVVRGAMELLLLAHERAAELVRATAAALAVTLVVALALVGSHGAQGAGWAALAGESVALALITMAAMRAGPRADLLVPAASSGLLAIVTGTAVALLHPSPLGGLLIGGMGSALGLALVWVQVTALERSAR